MIKRFIVIFGALATVAFMAVPASAGTTHTWWGNGFTESKFVSADSTVASYIFNTSNAYGSGSDPLNTPTEPYTATTKCLRFLADTGTGSLEAEIANGDIPSTKWPVGSCVVYDNEAQTGTPTAEQQSPETYMPQFNDDAIDAGFVPWDTPALDLGNTDTTCLKSTHGGSNLLWYENCHIAAKAVDVAGEATTFAAGIAVQSQTQVDSTCGSPPNNFSTLVADAESDVDGESSAPLTVMEVSHNIGTAAQAESCSADVGAANIDGVYIQDDNTDAGTTGGWMDTVLSYYKTNGW